MKSTSKDLNNVIGKKIKKLILTILVFLGFNQGNSYAETFPAGTSAFSFSFESIDGTKMDLSQYKGKALLVVNTASLCGFTGQYEGLQSLWEEYKDKGLVVIGVPSNNFQGQEPGSDEEIKDFCETTFGIDFPITEKTNVIGKDAHPFYLWARKNYGKSAIPKWNFHKIIIGKNGKVVNTFSSITNPSAQRFVNVIKEELKN